MNNDLFRVKKVFSLFISVKDFLFFYRLAQSDILFCQARATDGLRLIGAIHQWHALNMLQQKDVATKFFVLGRYFYFRLWKVMNQAMKSWMWELQDSHYKTEYYLANIHHSSNHKHMHKTILFFQICFKYFLAICQPVGVSIGWHFFIKTAR